MTRVIVVAGLLVWAGATLWLSQWRRLARPTLADRLRPYHPNLVAGVGEPTRGEPIRTGPIRTGPIRTGAVQPVKDVLLPLVRDAGDRMAAILGARESAAVRLRRIHADTAPVAFRVRQSAWMAVSLVAGAAVATAARVPPLGGAVLVLGAPLLAFLVVEQRLAQASDRWQLTTALELPVIAEQLAMLLNAGFSLGSALGRLAGRGHGCVARDLDRVVRRIHYGLTEAEALQEWAAQVDVTSVERLVGVLTLHSAAGDLGRLVTAEARQARRDLHRRTIEELERRSQQVWVPVTVATLVPGAILLAVPFLAALNLFANA